MWRLLLLLWVVCVGALALSVPGEGGISVSTDEDDHELASVMNIAQIPVPQGSLRANEFEAEAEPEPCTEEMQNVMDQGSVASPVEERESVENGERNAVYLSKRRYENEALPDALKHKSLRDIWSKELPCECQFNVWQPVCGVDGNTYPTACFADCIGMPVFVHADCKYVKRELWARFHANMANVPIDYYEECYEGDDDADDEPRRKCRRRDDQGPRAPLVPYAEDADDEDDAVVDVDGDGIPDAEEEPEDIGPAVNPPANTPTAADNTAADNTAADNTAADNTAADNTAADNTAADNTAADKAAADAAADAAANTAAATAAAGVAAVTTSATGAINDLNAGVNTALTTSDPVEGGTAVVHAGTSAVNQLAVGAANGVGVVAPGSVLDTGAHLASGVVTDTATGVQDAFDVLVNGATAGANAAVNGLIGAQQHMQLSALDKRLGRHHLPNPMLDHNNLAGKTHAQVLTQLNKPETHVTPHTTTPHTTTASDKAVVNDEDEGEGEGHIVWRMFQGVRVPYDTREIDNPCPHCPMEYSPACGSDGLTYPTPCFAVCVGANVASLGECSELK